MTPAYLGFFKAGPGGRDGATNTRGGGVGQDAPMAAAFVTGQDVELKPQPSTPIFLSPRPLSSLPTPSQLSIFPVPSLHSSHISPAVPPFIQPIGQSTCF